MTREQVYVLLNDIFRDVLADETVSVADETTPEDVPGWDSIAQISVLAAAEVRFGVEIRAAEAGRLATVGDLVGLILEKAPRLAAPPMPRTAPEAPRLRSAAGAGEE